jgi:hypothetical protein
MEGFKYVLGKAPAWYACAACKTSGVRLYRVYMCPGGGLLCRACVVKEAKDEDAEITLGGNEHDLGFRVAAVPTEGQKFSPRHKDPPVAMWGFTSVPPEGVRWWNSLPPELTPK